MAGIAGKTNNPNGRPPKSKALTNMLEVALGKTRLYNGKSVSGKKILAELVSSAVVTGKVQFPDDNEISIISVKDWIEFVKWVYERVDGKPVQPVGGDEGFAPIIVKLVDDARSTDS
jgi:hypothetical protein